PVIPLTGTPKDKDKESDSLLGAAGSSPIRGDAIATKVLERGETVAAPPGRADHFGWPNGTKAAAAAPQPNPVAPVAAQPKPPATGATSALAAAPADRKQQERKKGSGGKLTQQKPAKKPAPPEVTAPRPPQDDVLRPPVPIGTSSSPFGPRR
ncbi:MAG: hypothetical protein ACM3IH_23135, partial [Sphingobacteriales bacterium]